MKEFFKIIDTNDIILDVIDDKTKLYYVMETSNGLPIFCRSANDIKFNAFGIIVNGNIYSLNKPFKDYPICKLVEIHEDEYLYLHGLILEQQQSNFVEEGEESENDSSQESTLLPTDSYENNVNSKDESVMNFTKQLKLKELSAACKKHIINGVDLIVADGSTQHFDLTTEDQLNLNTLRYKLLNIEENEFPYHSKNNPFKYYSRDEIQNIINAMDNHILYHTSYFNAMKCYIEDIPEYRVISTIKYGDNVPEVYKSEILRALELKF